MKKAVTCTALLTLLLTCLCAMPQQATAATEGYYVYTVSGGEATITDVKDTISGEITIPAKLGGYPVTAVGEGAFAFRDITSVTIPAEITSIGLCAFAWCENLEEIYVSPYNPSYSSDDYGVLFNKNKTLLIQAPGAISETYRIPDSVKEIGANSFELTYDLEEVIIGSKVTKIGDYAFSECGITTLTIPSNVKEIGEAAFGWSYIYDLTISNGVEYIGVDAFTGNHNLETVKIPASVTYIGESAFADCSWLEKITVDKNNKNYCNDSRGVLYNKKKTNLLQAPGAISGAYDIPDSVTKIDGFAFYNCYDLTSVTVPGSAEIGWMAFDSCSSLKSVTLGNGITEIGVGAFASCTELKTITLPESLTKIESEVFWCCENLKSVTIPAAVREIGSYAFEDCAKLTDVYYGGTAARWAQVEIEEGNECLTKANMHYGSAQPEQPEEPEEPDVPAVPDVPAEPGAPGNLDGNGYINEDDAIYLLQYVLMPDMFPITQDVDFDGNGTVNEDDAIYLLQHILMPDMFPL